MSLRLSKVFIFLTIVLVIAGFKFFNLENYLTLAYIQENLVDFRYYYADHTLQTFGFFFGFYILCTAFSIPGAGLLTLVAGALFGKWFGILLVSFTSTIGATLAFLISRFFLRNFVQKKFYDKIQTINHGIKKEGGLYLLSLRLVPLFPFFLINMVMGLTSIRTRTFFLISQIGMLPGTFVYVSAGEEISKITSLREVFSPQLMLIFVLFGILPFLGKKFIAIIKTKRVYEDYQFCKPLSFDYNMLVIGGGAAGLVTSYISAGLKAKTALIEKYRMGGDCLNTGCVPSKALIKTAKVIHQAQQGEKYGLKGHSMEFDFAQVMERVKGVIKKIGPHDSVERYTQLGVDCFQGDAKILTPWEISVNGQRLSSKKITIATGSSPFVPSLPGLRETGYLTSDNLWDLRELPKKLIVLGGGPIGLEMAQSFKRLGSDVTVVEMGPRVMIKEDADVSEYVEKKLTQEGLKILTGHQAVAAKRGETLNQLICKREEGASVTMEFDEILVAVGRKANVEGFGLEKLEVDLNPDGSLAVNEYLQTNYPNIYACGDVSGGHQLTHMASHQAWYCAVNSLFGRIKTFKVDYSVVPWATYTDPEVATVGRMENVLKAQGVPYDVIRYDLDNLDRAIVDEENHGFLKVCVAKGKDKILGATIVGVSASETLIEFITAMKHGLGLNKILATIHPYPTLGEANKYLAGQWKQMNKPEKILGMLETLFRWQR